MVSMPVEQIGIYTIADLERERERDDRLRWELLDGELVMTPSPRPIHQDIVWELILQLAPTTPAGTRFFTAPLDVRLDEGNVLQPDLILVDEDAIEEECISASPILAIEILSPSTRRRDLVTKLDILARAGCAHYWVIDPADASVRIWELVRGAYRLVVHAHGDEPVTVTEPISLTLTVNELIPARWREGVHDEPETRPCPSPPSRAAEMLQLPQGRQWQPPESVGVAVSMGCGPQDEPAQEPITKLVTQGTPPPRLGPALAGG